MGWPPWYKGRFGPQTAAIAATLHLLSASALAQIIAAVRPAVHTYRPMHKILHAYTQIQSAALLKTTIPQAPARRGADSRAKARACSYNG